jgi:hypothetical protein
MSAELTRRRFLLHTLGMVGGTMVAGDLLPLLAEAAKRKQVLRVAVEVVFALPGIGRYAVDSLLVNDYAPVQGVCAGGAGCLSLRQPPGGRALRPGQSAGACHHGVSMFEEHT